MKPKIKEGYEFKNAELGVMSEILLPKKIEYQGSLFKVLKHGLTKFKFSKYFTSEDNIKGVNDLLNAYHGVERILDKNSLKEFDEKFNQVFGGYSMYEVDGVFFSRGSNNFIEDRTQIIRCFFVPNYYGGNSIESINSVSQIPEDFRRQIIQSFAELFFECSKITSYKNSNISGKLDTLLKQNAIMFNYKDEPDFTIANCKYIQDLKSYFIQWVDAVALFVFGFIIYEITCYLEKLKTKKNSIRKKEEHITCLEEEIWVTSHWGALINRTNYIKSPQP